jgi:hypothetical protein
MRHYKEVIPTATTAVDRSLPLERSVSTHSAAGA